VRAFKINKAQFQAQLQAAGSKMRSHIQSLAKKEGAEMLKQTFGYQPGAKGRTTLRNLVLAAKARGLVSFSKEELNAVMGRSKQATKSAVDRIGATLETEKISRLWHEQILKDQKRTMKEDLGDYVSRTWWIPQEFSVTRHSGLGSYIFLVAINIAVTVGETYAGARALQMLTKLQKLRKFRQARALVLRSRKARRVATLAATVGRNQVSKKIDESNVIDKVDRAIRTNAELHAAAFYHKVQDFFRNPLRV
jgi:hypothetical protein